MKDPMDPATRQAYQDAADKLRAAGAGHYTVDDIAHVVHVLSAGPRADRVNVLPLPDGVREMDAATARMLYGIEVHEVTTAEKTHLARSLDPSTVPGLWWRDGAPKDPAMRSAHVAAHVRLPAVLVPDDTRVTTLNGRPFRLAEISADLTKDGAIVIQQRHVGASVPYRIVFEDGDGTASPKPPRATKTKHGRAPRSTAPDRNARARAKVLANNATATKGSPR